MTGIKEDSNNYIQDKNKREFLGLVVKAGVAGVVAGTGANLLTSEVIKGANKENVSEAETLEGAMEYLMNTDETDGTKIQNLVASVIAKSENWPEHLHDIRVIVTYLKDKNILCSYEHRKGLNQPAVTRLQNSMTRKENEYAGSQEAVSLLKNKHTLPDRTTFLAVITNQPVATEMATENEKSINLIRTRSAYFSPVHAQNTLLKLNSPFIMNKDAGDLIAYTPEGEQNALKTVMHRTASRGELYIYTERGIGNKEETIQVEYKRDGSKVITTSDPSLESIDPKDLYEGLMGEFYS